MSGDSNDETGPTDDRRPSGGAVVGLVVVAVMAVLAGAVLFALTRDDGEQVSSGDDTGDATTTTEATTMVPTDPEPVEPDEPGEPVEIGPQGADSALVGMTELEVRELYPLVRVVSVDGEALPTTMDLQVGRIDLSLEDGSVVAASTEGCEDTTGEVPGWVRQACDPDPAEDGADSFGKLVEDTSSGALTLEVGFNGDEYYQGMTVRPADGEEPLVRGTDGSTLGTDDLVSNDVVWVWVSGPCAESSPVQCDLAAIVVDRPPTG